MRHPTLSAKPLTKIAIIGGGVAGTSIALRFAELGIDTTLLEKGKNLVDGPPFCHLHAGGNLYREISDEQCLTLLEQSIDTVKVYPHSINYRPTIFAVPLTDNGEPLDLLPCLEKLRAKYNELVQESVTNKVLGEPEDYFRLFDREELENLVLKQLPTKVENTSDWLVAFAKETNLDSLKYPVLLVQEYGMSAFRFAAIARLAMERLPTCHMQLNSQVNDLTQCSDSHKWQVTYKNTQTNSTTSTEFDYVINACGFKSGEVDDMVKAPRQRMVEFKAAYVTNWPKCKGIWPEVVFYGERGTPNGMAQLTPYPDGYFQLHGMTQNITLFEQGLVASDTRSAQPVLPLRFIKKIEKQWKAPLVKERTLGAIKHVAKYIPAFAEATVAAKPLFGAQQIPGNDANLRATDVSFYGKNYARAEIVKASSALTAADVILQKVLDTGLVTTELAKRYANKHYFPVTLQCTDEEVTVRATLIAKQRDYPEALAKNNETDRSK